MLNLFRKHPEPEPAGHKDAATALSGSEVHFRQAFDFAGTGMAIVGLDGGWLRVNRSLCEIVGYSEEELFKKTFKDITHPDDLDRDLANVHELLAGTRRHYEMEKRYFHRDGHVVWIRLNASLVRNAAGEPVHFISQIEDINARKQAEKELHDAQQFQEAILAGITHGVHGIDITGNIIFENTAAAKMLGWDPKELTGKPAHSTMHHHRPDGSAYSVKECPIYATMWDGNYRHVNNEVFWRKDGSSFPVEYSVAPIRSEDGDVTGAVVVFMDITERKLADDELRRAKDAAEAAARAKSAFLANMSHEIRTPMNGVVGMTSLLLDTPLTEEQRTFAETIRTSGESLLTVINDILDFSKIEAGKLVFENLAFDLRETVEGTLDMLAGPAQANEIELVGFIDAAVAIDLRGDPGRLRQVLTNLVGNAIKFTKRGTVTLRVTNESATADNATLRFEIKDTGIGISKEVQATLFRAFVQADGSTRRKFGGTGLGLAICRELVDQMQGRVGVESVPGEGSTFWFTAKFAKQSAGKTPHDDGHALTKTRVLIVDDNESTRQALHDQFTTWHMHSERSKNGAEALALLRTAAAAKTPYSLAVIDMEMPVMDGLALARAIKADPAISATRLILLTPFGKPISAETQAASGIAAFRSKPVHQSTLLNCLTDVVTEGKSVSIESRQSIEPVSLALGDKIRILIAEDNIVNQRVALGQLGKLGYTADTVANGLEAIDALGRIPYDIVLMDCQMPEMDGFQATTEIRKREGAHRRVWIIAMTANTMTGDRDACLSAGMDDYIGKPTKVEDLRAALSRVPAPKPE